YQQMCQRRPDLGLPRATSAAAVEDALTTWEAEHSDQMKDVPISATHLFGFTGGARLNGRFDFVLVPAVSDPEAETRDARGTLLRQLLDRALGEQSQMRARLDALERQVSTDVHQIMVAEGGEALRKLASGVTEELERLVPGGQVLLDTHPPTFRVPQLSVDVRVADGGLCTDVGHQGHGFQRALLIAFVQRLATLHPTRSEATAMRMDPRRSHQRFSWPLRSPNSTSIHCRAGTSQPRWPPWVRAPRRPCRSPTPPTPNTSSIPPTTGACAASTAAPALTGRRPK
ncbi:MAG: hypothetical protein M3Q75_11330, partial [Gemmatimonadota bacterium]|nr:hypothetical protein [Gemmatimonadota bacterium]